MYEIITDLYKTLMFKVEKRWSLKQIDEADIFFLFDLLYGSEKVQEKEEIVYAEQVPWL